MKKFVSAAGLAALFALPAISQEKEKTVIIINGKTINADKGNIITDNGDKIEIYGDSIVINGEPADKGQKVKTIIINKDVKTGRLRPGDVKGGNEPRPVIGILYEKKGSDFVITSVVENSGADKAGLKVGDVVTKVDGKEITDANDIRLAIVEKKVGDKVKLAIRRGKKAEIKEVTLGESSMKEDMNALLGGGLLDLLGEGLGGSFDVPGRSFRDWDFRRDFNFDGDDFRRFRFDDKNSDFDKPKLGLKLKDISDKEGVEVIEVEKGSLAEKSGFKVNDIITGVNGNKVSNTTKLEIAMAFATFKKSVEFEVERNGKKETITVTYPKEIKTVDI